MRKTIHTLFCILALVLTSCAPKETVNSFFRPDYTEVELVSGDAGEYDILIDSDYLSVGGSVDAQSAQWLRATINPRCLTFNFDENMTGESRTGSFTAEYGTFTTLFKITQPALSDEPGGGGGPDPDPEPEPEPDPEPEFDEPATYEMFDYYIQNRHRRGVVYWISEDKTRALVVSLERRFIVWSENTTDVMGASSTDEGRRNTETLATSDYALSIPALQFCSDLGEGWYWPSREEMKLVFAAYNGTDFNSATNAAPDAITADEKAARAAFDKLLSEAGYDVMNSAPASEKGDDYWTSTEWTEKYANAVRFGKPYSSVAADQQGKNRARYVRLIKEITLGEGGGTGGGGGEDHVETKFAVYKENGKAVGIIYHTDEQNQTAKVLSLGRTESIAWSTAGTSLLGSSSRDNGAENTAILASSVEADNIPAIKYCNSLGEGWYWPAIDEMVQIFDIYNGIPYNDAACSKKVPAEISQEEKDARAAFDLSLTAHGGTAMNTAAAGGQGNRYWTSTEFVAGDAHYGSFVVFGKAYVSAPADTPGKTREDGNRFARCIKIIDKH